METGLVFDLLGMPLYWHAPPGRSNVFIPDDRTLWEVIWNSREYIGGVAHTHPWSGKAEPSQEDLTTFAAVEAGLGKRLHWPIVTFTEDVYFRWEGPASLDYSPIEKSTFCLNPALVEYLRALSEAGVCNARSST